MNLIQVQEKITPLIAMESISNIEDKSFGNMVKSIADFFPSLNASFAGVSDHLETLKAVPSSVLTSFSNSFKKDYLNNEDFRTYSKIKINVPESFTGNLLSYSMFLERSWEFLQIRVIPELDLFYARLASFASNRESKISLLDSSGSYKNFENMYHDLVKESETYFSKTKHNSSKLELGTAFNDFDEYKKAEDKARDLAKQLNTRQISQILDKVKKITKILDIIIEDAKNKEYDKASFESVKSLASGIYTFGSMIEFYSVTYYRITDLSFSMSENIAIVKKLK